MHKPTSSKPASTLLPLSLKCPLCGNTETSLFHRDKVREYHQCATCQLVFVPKKYHLSEEAEKSIYDLHQNNALDSGYRHFLSRIYDPICAKIKPPAIGLDFGSGPGPVLSTMFQEAGYDMSIYDIYYAPQKDVLRNAYDFITCSEVIEHVKAPDQIFNQILTLLKPNAWLGMMTKLVIDQKAFQHWHYKNDPTHICFFSKDTFYWVADRFSLELEFIGKDVILMRSQ